MARIKSSTLKTASGSTTGSRSKKAQGFGEGRTGGGGDKSSGARGRDSHRQIPSHVSKKSLTLLWFIFGFRLLLPEDRLVLCASSRCFSVERVAWVEHGRGLLEPDKATHTRVGYPGHTRAVPSSPFKRPVDGRLGSRQGGRCTPRRCSPSSARSTRPCQGQSLLLLQGYFFLVHSALPFGVMNFQSSGSTPAGGASVPWATFALNR